MPENVSSKASVPLSGNGRQSLIWPSWKLSNRVPAADIIHMWLNAVFCRRAGTDQHGRDLPWVVMDVDTAAVDRAELQTGVLALPGLSWPSWFWQYQHGTSAPPDRLSARGTPQACQWCVWGSPCALSATGPYSRRLAR